MRRRDFIRTVVGSVAAFPFAARAQQPERTRRVGVLMSLAADDKQGQARVDALVQGLRELGWIDGRNVQIEIRWAPGEDRARKYAAELVALSPDVILASGQRGRPIAASDPHRPHRVHADPRSRRRWVCR